MWPQLMWQQFEVVRGLFGVVWGSIWSLKSPSRPKFDRKRPRPELGQPQIAATRVVATSIDGGTGSRGSARRGRPHAMLAKRQPIIEPNSGRNRAEIGPRSGRDRAENEPKSGRHRAEIGLTSIPAFWKLSSTIVLLPARTPR